MVLVGAGPATATHKPVTVAKGLVAWWPGNGNARDVVGDLDAELQNGAKFDRGIIRKAFKLDGVDDFVSVPSGSKLLDFGLKDFTVALWVRFRDAAAGEQVLIEKWVQSADWSGSSGWTLTKTDERTIRFAAASVGVPEVDLDVVPKSIRNDCWYFVVVQRRKNEIRIHWNGVLLGSLYAVVNLNSDSSLKFGHRGTSEDTPGSIETRNVYLNGLIDEVRIYSRALSGQEIWNLYKAGIKFSRDTKTR